MPYNEGLTVINIDGLKKNLDAPWVDGLGEYRTVGYYGRAWGNVQIVQVWEGKHLFIMRNSIVKEVTANPELALHHFFVECDNLVNEKPAMSMMRFKV